MKKIDIQITKAQIEYFSVSLESEKPEVNIRLGLYTEGGKKITDYTISTGAWKDDLKFELSPELVQPIMMVMRELEVIATRHCNKGQKTLEADYEI